MNRINNINQRPDTIKAIIKRLEIKDSILGLRDWVHDEEIVIDNDLKIIIRNYYMDLLAKKIYEGDKHSQRICNKVL